MNRATVEAKINVIIGDSKLREERSGYPENNFMRVLKETKHKHKPSDSSNLVFFTYLVAVVPICMPINEPIKIKVASIISMFPLTA